MKISHTLSFSILTLLILLAVASSPLLSSIDGESSETTMEPIYGCNCHSANWTLPPDLVVSLDPPDPYEMNQVYTMTITATGGPVVNQSGHSQGGFTLWADYGELSPTDNTTILVTNDSSVVYPYLTHTEHGNDQRTWVVNWTAPEYDDTLVTMVVKVLVTNGDGNASEEDQWGSKSYKIWGQNYQDDEHINDFEGEPDSYKTPGFGIIAAISAAAIAALGRIED